MTMKSLLICLALPVIILNSCEDSRPTSSSCYQYPAQIDSLRLSDLYDTARWYLYSWLCDQEFDGNYRGQFPIIYKDFIQRNDTIELFFLQYTPSESKDPSRINTSKVGQDSTRHRCSVAFNIRSKKPLWCFDINGFSSGLSQGDSKFDNTRSDTLLNFIRIHKTDLDPCFLELANKIGFIQD